jgi:hypothetical protein
MPQGTANVFSLCMCCLFQFSFFWTCLYLSLMEK